MILFHPLYIFHCTVPIHLVADITHSCCTHIHACIKCTRTYSANVLLEEGWKAKLADFGLVRSLSVEASTAVTGTVVGTMVYMAPEYLMGVVSPAADIYALGVVSYIS